jgi:hypothetical protein
LWRHDCLCWICMALNVTSLCTQPGIGLGTQWQFNINQFIVIPPRVNVTYPQVLHPTYLRQDQRVRAWIGDVCAVNSGIRIVNLCCWNAAVMQPRFLRKAEDRFLAIGLSTPATAKPRHETPEAGTGPASPQSSG